MRMFNRIEQALSWRLKALRDRLTLSRARRHRQRLKDTVFVGITGSAGKTTTKDLALAVLSCGGETSGNAASLNYLVDVAHVVLAAKRSNRYTVVEIGASGPGSLDDKIALTQPLLAALTVVQRDHIKNFESVEAIAAEKGKLIHALPAHGTAVLNIDDPLVRHLGEQARARRLWFGSSPDADLRLVEATSAYPAPLTLILEFEGRRHTCTTALHGTHLAVPVLAAIGLGLAAGIAIERCVEAIAGVATTPGRMQIVAGQDGVTFVRDDYKSPHWAFQAALDHLKAAQVTRRVAVIGTLSDYSLSASKLYPKVARQAMEAAELVVFVGPHALRALKARRSEDDRSLLGFTEIEQAHKYLQGELRAGDLVLLKGSNRADHLVRLMLARSRPVTCWSIGCGLNRFCDACPRLDDPASAPGARTAATARPANDVVSGQIAHSSEQQPAGDPNPDTWLVVGMGNAGDRYAGTPHNIGFEALDHLARKLSLNWVAEPDGMLCRASIGGADVLLLKPATLINECGDAVQRVRSRHGVRTDRVIVVHDDTDLALADARLKRGGSDGGHKGVRSVLVALGNDGAMPRVRIGVRHAGETAAAAKSLVLQRLDDTDAGAIQAGLEKAMALLQTAVAVEPNGPSLSARGPTSHEGASEELGAS